MVSPVDKPVTLESLYRLPDDGSRYELTRGHLVAEPPPGAQHGRIITSVVFELTTYVRRHDCGVVLTADAGFVLARDPDTVRAPDIAYVRRERYLSLQDERGLFFGPPDLAVEVLSPNDRPGAVQRKIADYLDNGTPLVWILNPERRDARVYRPGATERVEPDRSLQAPDLLPGFDMPLAPLFRRPWRG